MLGFLLKRAALALAVAVTVSIISFLLLRASGDIAVAVAGEGATEADIEAIRIQFGFDRPLIVQYFEWAGNALTGDLGQSVYFRVPVVELIGERMPVTMGLGALALVFAVALSIPLGVAAALRPNSIIDRLSLWIAVLGQAMPSFWFALLLMLVMGVWWRWLPISGAGGFDHYIMPAIALGYYATPAIMRLTRAGMIEVLESDYIRTAHAKGLGTGKVLFKHALRNAVIPVVSLAAVQFGFMLSGSIVIESIFALPGVGHLAWISLQRSDFTVVQGIVLMLSVIYILMALVADLFNAWLDPRIRVA
ncbi:peptide/nickel transport system permease protein [Albimonas donghaensis]|uniref:Peptide/nickel transport system permease protein n=1 Tax=Albimonas donghaensis TaxID=356660 RepID=A0A1H3AW62_9RHOB|nr:ABC transporter permease [Albimonas donghaensis]MAS43183.1 ABC transporter permease [Paracoccaceae bacterium]MBR26960.1 ABC transporter permease [Paracoccaceae bacterium]SDX33845.1 peptide/nickel transport system permease protein [Albimonas donghaensis]